MRSLTGRTRDRKTERGLALIVALLALTLMSFLGLTLALTTTTEVQIASNYRISQQAYHVALSGVEIARRYLALVEFRAVLPVARPNTQMSNPPTALWPAAVGPEGEVSRDFELWQCDSLGSIGYGIVLYDVTQALLFQNTSVYLSRWLNGTVTLWVRRPLIRDGAGVLADEQRDDELVLTVEGSAPYIQGSPGAANVRATTTDALRSRAVRTLEVRLSRKDPSGGCYDPSCGGGR